MHCIRRTAIVVVLAWLAAACTDHQHLLLKQLPPLAANQAAIAPLAFHDLNLLPGERLIWDVHLDGLTIGRAEMFVADSSVHSKFKTDGLISSLVNLEHELTTVIDRPNNRAVGSTERFLLDGETKQLAATFDGATYAVGDPAFAPGQTTHSVPGGNPGQTVHSALGALRAWAQPNARGGFLYVLLIGQLYRLDVSQPLKEDLHGTSTLRIECRVRLDEKASDAIAVTLWFTADAPRKPIQIEIKNAGKDLTAELIDS